MQLDILGILRRGGLRSVTHSDAMLFQCAISKLPGFSSNFLRGNQALIEDLSRCSPITSNIFIPVSFCRLTHMISMDELFAPHGISGCSLDAARSHVDAKILVGIMDPHDQFYKVGPLGLYHGCMYPIKECMTGVVVCDPFEFEKVSKLLNEKECFIPISLDEKMRLKKYAGMRTFTVKIPRFSISGDYEASNAHDAVQMALDEAFEDREASSFYRRKPKEFSAGFYLADPVIASDIVQEKTSLKTAQMIGFSVGDRVETGSTNGFFGGKRGYVVGINGRMVHVKFDDHSSVSYDMSLPASAVSLKKIRRL